MNTQAAFKKLMRNVLVEHIPAEQLDFFDFVADSQIAELFGTAPTPITTGPADAYGFGIPNVSSTDVKPVLEYMGLMMSTFKAMRETYAWWKKREAKTEEELKARLRTDWLGALQGAGVAGPQANRIVDTFLSDAAALTKQFQTATP